MTNFFTSPLSLKASSTHTHTATLTMPTEFLLFMLFQNLVLLASSAEPVIVKNPDCQQQCGNISIPYPFGVGENCSIGRLAVLCNTTFNPPKLFFAYLLNDYDNDNLEIVQLSQTQVRVRNSVSTTCHNAAGYLSAFVSSPLNLSNTPYTFSEQNKFTVIGCGTIGVIQEIRETSNRSSSGGCVSLCYEYGSVVDGSCSGIGCCQTSIPNGLSRYVAYVDAFNVSKAFNVSNVYKAFNVSKAFNPFNVSNAFNNSTHGLLLRDNCFRAFMADNYTFKQSDIYSLRHTTMMLDFAIGNQTCEVARLDTATFACKENSDCYHPKDRTGYICNCTDGYEGNPYLGCHEIKKIPLEKNNLPSTQLTIGLEIGLSFGMGLLFLLVVASCIYFSRKKRKRLRIREMFFQQNGGLLLKQHISSCEGGGSESIKIFTADDLELATNNYDERRILGQGGFGTVYRGILPDLRIVAIKKSKVVDASQLGQFINEVIILTQINHRNIVKLLGCCLETEVPLLVYEFVSNGTLSHHICKKGGASSSSSSISWENRLRIAAETAGALAYLHSAASIPIIHRDVKSSNILLDENYTAKVADFGASRLNPLDQTQISTLVKGTWGYLDPEYFHTSQLTEKSDVYSFGVVLAELLTGEKPLCLERSLDKRSLATYFIVSMRKNCLSQILDNAIVNEDNVEQVYAVAELVNRCLGLNGDERPSMKEVASELEQLRGFKRNSLTQKGKKDDMPSETEMVDLYPISSSSNHDGSSVQYSLDTETLVSMNVPR